MKRTVISWWLMTCLLLGALLLFPAGVSPFNYDLIPTSPTVPVGSGARAQGMGGAFIAVADDATAASWNPGGLGQIEKPEMCVVGNYFLRREDWGNPLEDEGGSQSSSSDLNYLSFTYARNIWQRNIFFSINYQRLFDFNRSVQFEISNPYEHKNKVVTQKIDFHQEGSLYALSPAMSIEFIPGFYAGFTKNIWSDSKTGKSQWESKCRSVFTSSNSSLVDISEVSMSYENFTGENWTLGFLWQISQQFQLGGVYKTPFQASVICKSHYRFTSGLNLPDKERTFQINYPAAYGVGLSYRLGDSWTFAGDVTRTRWQDYTIVEKGREIGPFSKGDVVPKKDPAYSIRLGVERAFILDDKMGIVLPLRFGGFYDPEPSVNAPHDYYGASFGIGIADKHLALDFAYQYRTGPAVNATETGLVGANEVKILRHLFLSSLIFYY